MESGVPELRSLWRTLLHDMFIVFGYSDQSTKSVCLGFSVHARTARHCRVRHSNPRQRLQAHRLRLVSLGSHLLLLCVKSASSGMHILLRQAHAVGLHAHSIHSFQLGWLNRFQSKLTVRFHVVTECSGVPGRTWSPIGPGLRPRTCVRAVQSSENPCEHHQILCVFKLLSMFFFCCVRIGLLLSTAVLNTNTRTTVGGSRVKHPNCTDKSVYNRPL